MEMIAKEAHISVRDLTMAYGDFVVMRNLTFDINRADIFIIMGGSGCGKSTLMNILIGLNPPAQGKVLYGDVDFWGADPQTRDRIIRRAGVMYQSGALWSSMTLAENSLPETYTDLTQADREGVVETGAGRIGRIREFIPRSQRRMQAGGIAGPCPGSELPMSLPPGWIRRRPPPG
jgi:phospholipid/cholesterol/gamma-HCH transport system ATP-binding protein